VEKGVCTAGGWGKGESTPGKGPKGKLGPFKKRGDLSAVKDRFRKKSCDKRPLELHPIFQLKEQ